jgi:hypothetical protein
MSSFLSSAIHRTITISFMLLLFCAVSAAAPKNRIIKRASLPDEPVEITEIKVKEAKVNFWEKFAGDDDWLSGITFTVKNTSGKNISHVALLIEQPISESFSLTIPIGEGQFSPLSENAVGPVIARAGETVEIRLSDERYKGFMHSVPLEFKFDPITEVKVHIERVVFTDGSMWYKGMLHYRDPNNSKRWLPAPGEKERFLEKMHARKKTSVSLLRRPSSSALIEERDKALFQPINYIATPKADFLKSSQTRSCIDYYWTEYRPCAVCESRYGDEDYCSYETDVVGGQGEFSSVTTLTSCFSFYCGFCESVFTTRASYAGPCQPA